MDLIQIEKRLSEDCSLKKDLPLLVGVSGGPDSLCLLHLLHALGYSLIAAHVNHQLRPEADAEAAYVARFALSLNVPFCETRLDVMAFAQKEKLSVEESARFLRYRYLLATAKETGAHAVAVAHQADDQVETVLMHLLRGAGLSGLKGMPYRGYLPTFSETTPIVRPLLGVWRQEIEEYCAENALEACYDASNQDVKYFRNRIRHELMPLLRTFNERGVEHVWQLSQLAGAEDAFLEKAAEMAKEEAQRSQGQDYVIFDEQAFQRLNLALQRRLLRAWVAELQQNVRDISFEAIEKALVYLGDLKRSGTCQLLDGMWLNRFSDSQMALYLSSADFSPELPLLAGKQQIELVCPGITPLNQYWQIEANWIDRGGLSFATDEWTALVDAEKCSVGLRLTSGDSAERLSYLGNGEHTLKLGDLFTDKKVFRPARPRWPVVRCGEEILWVPGLKRARIALVNERTHKILKLHVSRK